MTEINFPLHRERLYEQVADRVEELIISESLQAGDRLPSERNLADRLGVSRPVIREATRVLCVRGLVEVKPGSGTYIKELTPEGASEPIQRLLIHRKKQNTFANLHEIRRTLEVEIVGLAAERATKEDLEALEAALEGQIKNIDDSELFTQYDLKFHAALAAATKNDLYTLLLKPITDLLLEFRLAAYHYDRLGAVEGGLTHHRKVLDRVRAHDPEVARQVMRNHLKQAESLYWAEREQNSST